MQEYWSAGSYGMFDTRLKNLKTMEKLKNKKQHSSCASTGAVVQDPMGGEDLQDQMNDKVRYLINDYLLSLFIRNFLRSSR